jgi:hypothetical protein
MTPSPEQLEHIRISQRASLRNAQTFQLFATMVAGGKRPDEALKEAEAAIDAWGEYEDAHAIEPPPTPGVNELLSKFGDMADRLRQNRVDNDLTDLVTEMANALEESVNVLENEGRRTKSNKMLLSRICDIVARADNAIKSAPDIRRALASTDPKAQHDGGSPQ